MAVFDWPLDLIPQRCAIGSQGAGLQFKGPYNGTTQALSFVAERWTMSCTLPQRRRVQAGQIEALLFRLRGGENRVRAYHFGRPVPVGSLRGAPQLFATTARGNTDVVLGQCQGRNIFAHNHRTQIAQWADFAPNVVITANAAAAPDGTPSADLVAATAVNGGHLIDGYKAYSGAGQYTFSVFVKQSGVSKIWMHFLSAGEGYDYQRGARFDLAAGLVYQLGTSASSAAISPVGNGWYRCSVTGQIDVIGGPIQGIRLVGPGGEDAWAGDGSSGVYLWGLQLEIGDLTDYEVGASLEPGDMLQLPSGQLVMAAEGTVANESGIMTVPLVHRVRGVNYSGTAVEWNKPTAEFVMPADLASVMHVPGGVEGAALELEEVW